MYPKRRYRHEENFLVITKLNGSKYFQHWICSHFPLDYHPNIASTWPRTSKYNFKRFTYWFSLIIQLLASDKLPQWHYLQNAIEYCFTPIYVKKCLCGVFYHKFLKTSNYHLVATHLSPMPRFLDQAIFVDINSLQFKILNGPEQDDYLIEIRYSPPPPPRFEWNAAVQLWPSMVQDKRFWLIFIYLFGSNNNVGHMEGFKLIDLL